MLAALLVFAAAYTLQSCYISIFYHRALAHGAVRLGPAVRAFVAATGSWVTALDPKAWVAMHRKHHACSDERDDPHSPRNVGIRGVLTAQLRAYERELFGLLAGHASCTARVADLDFPVSWCNRRGLWWLPYAAHAAIATGIGAMAGPLVGVAWFAGLMSHPIAGWMVNSIGHAIGRRNFDTHDDSRNNWLVALLVFGEGLQNNHHHRPRSPRFAFRWYEPDLGFALCRVLAWFRLVELDEARVR
jgi:stearoyl-CoA desaturase (delta-9 desaturase)